jgi:hypothetical protein
MRTEYLYLPAVRMQYASEFGHLIRILAIFAKMEYVLDELSGWFFAFIHCPANCTAAVDPKIPSNPMATLNEAEQKMDVCACSIWHSMGLMFHFRNGIAPCPTICASRSRVCRCSNPCLKQVQTRARGVGACCIYTMHHAHWP